MPKTCFECGEVGHVRTNCPNIICHKCKGAGHMARDCSAVSHFQPRRQTQQQQQQRRNSAKPRLDTSGLPPPSSNAHKIPAHWKISSEYTTLANAVTGLWKEERKFKMFQADAVERAEIEELLTQTWKHNVVGIGADARNLSHTDIQVVKVERVENPEMYERYSERKQKLLRRLRDPDLGDTAFTPVDKLPGSTGPVLTTRRMQYNSFLRRNIYPKINEHYLFHGTKDEIVYTIARDGMDNRFGSHQSLLGAGLYTAESCTKADQYTDNKSSRSSGGMHKMFLVRVLVGEPFINTSKNPPKFQRPPCKSCQQILCNCAHTQHYDSVLDDSGRLFREFVVYEQCQCYPEYVITYTRVGEVQYSSPPRSVAPVTTYTAPVASYKPSTAPLASYKPSPAPVASYNPAPAPVASYKPAPAPVASYKPSPAPAPAAAAPTSYRPISLATTTPRLASMSSSYPARPVASSYPSTSYAYSPNHSSAATSTSTSSPSRGRATNQKKDCTIL